MHTYVATNMAVHVSLMEDSKVEIKKTASFSSKNRLSQVQRRREERELEQAARAEELDRVRLEKEREMFKEWQDQEGQVSFTTSEGIG